MSADRPLRGALLAIAYLGFTAPGGPNFDMAAAPSSASVDTQLQAARDTLANCQMLAAHSSLKLKPANGHSLSIPPRN